RQIGSVRQELLFFVFFFFSSRRRHTRWPRDWSSDVCSSDLPIPERFARNGSVFLTATDVFLWTNYTGLDPIANGNDAAVGGSGRSEERRVGKECRSRWVR